MTTPTPWATTAQFENDGSGPDLRDGLWRTLDAQIAADCRARADVYAANHGGLGLHAGGHRDRLVDAYQEALDLVTYLLLHSRRAGIWPRMLAHLAEQLAIHILGALHGREKRRVP